MTAGGKSSKQMVAEALSQIVTLSADEALKLHGDPRVVFVDLRDPRELEREGLIPGSFHAPRGMLEFWIDPESPYHKPVFAADKKFVFYCAGGGRSALAGKTAVEMGLKDVAHIGGGLAAWKKIGAPVAQKDAGPKPAAD